MASSEGRKGILGRGNSRAEAQRWMQGKELGGGAWGLRWQGALRKDQSRFPCWLQGVQVLSWMHEEAWEHLGVRKDFSDPIEFCSLEAAWRLCEEGDSVLGVLEAGPLGRSDKASNKAKAVELKSTGGPESV